MELLKFAIKLAQKAGKAILKEAKNIQITEKSKNDFVTNADQAAETLITNAILKKYPDHAILAEEASFNVNIQAKDYVKSKYIWIIDPLDGTTNFSHGLPIYSVSIALFKTEFSESSKNFDYLTGEIVLGVVYAPAMNELFYAIKGKGAYLNNKKIQVSKTKTLESSLLVTGFPPTHKKMNLPYFMLMLEKGQAVRRLGSAALDLAYIAAGRFDGYWEFDLKPWDIAAGALLVSEAGGEVSDINGNLLDLFGKEIMATNGKIHQNLIKSFQTL